MSRITGRNGIVYFCSSEPGTPPAAIGHVTGPPPSAAGWIADWSLDFTVTRTDAGQLLIQGVKTTRLRARALSVAEMMSA